MAKQFLSVSTKTGDQGLTSLANGERVSKADLVFDVVGTLDELNSWLGVVVVQLDANYPEHKKMLLGVQDTLFYMGGELAYAGAAKLSAKQLSSLETVATELQKSMQENWHTKFVLPGGSELGAWIDVTRTVCRRLEREVVRYSMREEVRPVILQYLNRLSDYLYVLRCFVNHAQEYPENYFNLKK